MIETAAPDSPSPDSLDYAEYYLDYEWCNGLRNVIMSKAERVR